MKIKILTLLLTLTAVLAVLVSGCAGGVPETDYNNIVIELEEAKSKVAALESDLAAAQEQLSVLEDELDAAAEELDQAEALRDSLQQQLDLAEEMFVALQEKIALDFVKNSPTFLFDGIADTLKLVNSEELETPFTTRFIIEFDSSNYGFGDRTDKPVLTVITPHQAVILVEQNEITSAVLDEQWNILTQSLIGFGLEDITWVLTSYTGEMGTRQALEGVTVTLLFDSAEGRLGGFTGVNHYGAPYEITGSSLTLTEDIFQTLVLSTDEKINEQETNFLEALRAAEYFQIEDDILTITGGDWTLVFEKQP